MNCEMTLNGRNIAEYNCRLLNYSVGGTVITHSTASAEARLKMPLVYQTTLAPRTLSISLTFAPVKLGSDSRRTTLQEKYQRATENIARFESEIIGKTVEIGLPDGFLYTASITTLGAATFDGSGEHDVTYTFSAIRHLRREIVRIKGGDVVKCKSNTETPFKVRMMLSRSSNNLKLCGVHITDVIADKEIVIDSEKGLITMDGVNKFADSDLYEFPMLSPGDNIIDCNNMIDDIIVEYTPLFA